MGSHPVGLEAAADSKPPASLSTQTVTVYTRPPRILPQKRRALLEAVSLHEVPLRLPGECFASGQRKRHRSWKRRRSGHRKSAISWSPVKALQRELEAKLRGSEAREVLITDAVALFLKEVGTS